MRQVRQPGLLSKWFLVVLSLVLCSGQAVPGKPGFAPQENAAATKFEALAKSAGAEREAGKVDEALRDYAAALEIRADWTEGWWYVGTLEYDKDEYAKAIPAFQRLVQLSPAAGPGWNFLGLCEFETRDYDKSLEHLKKGQALGDADDPEISRVASYHLALLLIRSGEFDQANSLLASTFGEGQVSPRVRTALGMAMLRVPLFPGEVDLSQDALLYAAGETATVARLGDRAKTDESFRELAKTYPGIPYLHYAHGKTLAAAARYEEALTEQRKEEIISPKSALPRIEISRLQLRLQHPQEAVRAAEEAVQLAPDSEDAHNALGQALRGVGKEEKAAEEMSEAKKLATQKILPEVRMTQIYARHTLATGIGDVQVAGGESKGAGSETFDELSRSAWEAQGAGQTELAIQNFQQALQLRPGWDDGRWNLAMICYNAAKYPEAISALKSFVEHKPAFGTAWAVMGLSEFEIKDYGNALLHLQRGEELGLGGSAAAVRLAKYRLGLLLVRDGQFESAMRTLAPVAGTTEMGKQIEFALGMALLRMPLLPEQTDPSKASLIQTAGEIAVLLQESKYDEAFPKFELRVKEYPTQQFLHYAYGTAFAALSQYDEAKREFQEEMRISPASELPYIGLASLELKQHQAAEALPLARTAVKLSPGSGEAHYLLGRALLELGQEGAAVNELETAGKLVPGSPEVHFNLAKAYAKAKRADKAEQERAIFRRLNALAEEQRSHSGNQAYGGSHNATGLAPGRLESTQPAKPEHLL
jgi:tetratricopeptide (TPR) repeat protein